MEIERTALRGKINLSQRRKGAKFSRAKYNFSRIAEFVIRQMRVLVFLIPHYKCFCSLLPNCKFGRTDKFGRTGMICHENGASSDPKTKVFDEIVKKILSTSFFSQKTTTFAPSNFCRL
jgi:hypothetical protein